jgi:hypothetical protein
MLGHSDIKTTQRYLNITDEEVRKALTGVWERRRQLKVIDQVRLKPDTTYAVGEQTRSEKKSSSSTTAVASRRRCRSTVKQFLSRPGSLRQSPPLRSRMTGFKGGPRIVSTLRSWTLRSATTKATQVSQSS